jgi:hypothetical protein
VVVEVVIYCVVVPDFGNEIDSPLGQYPGTDALCKGRALPVIKPSSKTGPFHGFSSPAAQRLFIFVSLSPCSPHGLFPCRAGTGH